MSHILSQFNYGLIGEGPNCQALLRGFLRSNQVPKDRIFLSFPTPARLKKTAERFGVQVCSGNEELAQRAQLIFLCLEPAELVQALEPLSQQLTTQQTVFSFSAGVSLSTVKKLLPGVTRLVRVVPNAPMSVGEGLFAYSLLQDNSGLESFVEELFSPLGQVFKLPEKDLNVFTVAASSGVSFVLELMQYWNEWLENHHFPPELARKISVQTFLGASAWVRAFPKLTLSELQLQVASSKKEGTAEGLKAFNEAQLASILHYGFEKSTPLKKKIIKS